MIKYSLVLLTAAAVIFSATGCDGECCGTPAPTAVIAGLTAGQTITASSFTLSGTSSHDNNSGGTIEKYSWTVDGVVATDGQELSAGSHEVCLTVTDNDDLTNKTCGTVIIGVATAPVARFTLPAECEPTNTLTLSGSASTGSGGIDTYAWTGATDATDADNTVVCPAAGVAQEVCLTVTDAAGLTDQTCRTVTGAAAEITCNPSITAKNAAGVVVTTAVAGGNYTFDNNVTDANCPNVECTWSVKSHNATAGTFFTCLIENSHAGTGDEPPVNDDGITYHVNLVGTGSTASISVATCSSVYDYFEVTLNCTNPTVNQTASYDLPNNP